MELKETRENKEHSKQQHQSMFTFSFRKTVPLSCVFASLLGLAQGDLVDEDILEALLRQGECLLAALCQKEKLGMRATVLPL